MFFAALRHVLQGQKASDLAVSARQVRPHGHAACSEIAETAGGQGAGPRAPLVIDQPPVS